MANYILRSGNNLLTSGNRILTSSSNVPAPEFDINPELWAFDNNANLPVLTDASGNNINYHQPDASKQAVFIHNAINGKPAFKVDGVDDYYEAIIAANVKTIFVVVKATATSQFYRALFGDNSSTYGYFLGGSGNEYFTADLGFGASAHNRLFVNGYNVVPKQNALRQTYFTLMVLDVAENINVNIFRIGATRAQSDLTPTYFFAGEYARIIGYRNRLTETQRKAKENELMAYYNL